MKVIILIHGFLGEKGDFDNLIPHLQNHYDHIEAVTLPGHGEFRGKEPFECEACLKKIIEIFDKIEKTSSQIDVIGYSMGGALAIYLSQNRSFNKLVLISPACKYFNFRLPFSRYRLKYRLSKELKEAERNQDQDKVRELTSKLNHIKDDDKLSLDIVRKGKWEKGLLKNFMNFRRLIKEINQGFKCIKNKTLILWGEIDQLVPKKSIDYITTKCVDYVQKTYENMSHLMILSKHNKEVITDIIEFLQEDKEQAW